MTLILIVTIQASIFFSKSADGLEWLRPGEMAQEPRLMEGGADRFDINQGELGDCWLLAATANLTMNKKVGGSRGERFGDDGWRGVKKIC